MPFQPVLDAFGGNLKIVGTCASTANQHAPHFADDRLEKVPHYSGAQRVYWVILRPRICTQKVISMLGWRGLHWPVTSPWKRRLQVAPSEHTQQRRLRTAFAYYSLNVAYLPVMGRGMGKPVIPPTSRTRSANRATGGPDISPTG